MRNAYRQRAAATRRRTSQIMGRPSRSRLLCAVISKRPPSVIPSRRLPTEFAADIRQFAAPTGLALRAWNSLHASLFLLFWHLIRGGHPRMTQAAVHRIWHTIQNDTTQREMFLGAVQTDQRVPPTLAIRVVWLVQTAASCPWRSDELLRRLALNQGTLPSPTPTEPQKRESRRVC
jgi:hypothetical protein